MGTIRSSSSTATPENIPNMNGFVLSFLALAVASASAFYDPATGVFTLGSMSLNGANALALTSGSTTVFLTSAGIAAAGLAILGAAVVKTALLEGGARSKREAPTESLEKMPPLIPPLPRLNTTSPLTWVKPPAQRLPAPVDTPDAPWTAKPSHKLWLKWPEFSNKTGLLLVNNFLVKGSNILII